MAYTPGEWTTRKAKSGNDFAIVAAGYLIVAEVFEQIGEDTVIDPDDNACLIAAAPEMLEALKAIRYTFEKGDNIHIDIKQMVHAVIAKAEGQP